MLIEGIQQHFSSSRGAGALAPSQHPNARPACNASRLCSTHIPGMEQLTHGVHCRVGLHDLMGILRILCNQVVASLHDVLKLWVLYVFCPSLDV